MSEPRTASSAKRKRVFVYLSASVLLLLIVIGVFGRNGWLPRTDAMTGEKFGWFGTKLPKNAGSTWNPLAAPLPTATPQLSKEGEERGQARDSAICCPLRYQQNPSILRQIGT